MSILKHRGLDQQDADEVERRKAELRSEVEAEIAAGVRRAIQQSHLVRPINAPSPRRRYPTRPPVLINQILEACKHLADEAGSLTLDALLEAIGKDPNSEADRKSICGMIAYIKSTKSWDYTIVFRKPGYPKGKRRQILVRPTRARKIGRRPPSPAEVE